MIKLIMAALLVSPMAFAASPMFEENAPPSPADHLHLSHSKDPVDGGWLPNLTGLPDEEEVAALTNHAIEVLKKETDSKCNSLDFHLKLLILQHFLIHQNMANAQGIYFNEKTAEKWAHILGMILKESSGESTNVSDMTGRAVTYRPHPVHPDLDHWRQVLNLAVQKRIKMNYQTNFGLTQISSDRLFTAFHLAKNPSYDTELLEGKQGAATPRKVALNTSIAIRRLIWFYQDFAQGRLTQSDKRIHQQDITKPEYIDRYKAGLDKVILYCGTRLLFHRPSSNVEETPEELAKAEKAVASIAYCKLGNAQSGYGKNEFDEKCFAEWVTLCPALNIDIAILTPLSYFETRKEKPVCVNTFKRLLIQKPTSKNNSIIPSIPDSKNNLQQ